MTHPIPTSRLLTISEAANYVRSPVATLRYWRHCGIGPTSLKIGRHVMYRVADLEAWIDEMASSHNQNAATWA